MAFYELIFKESMSPANGDAIIKSLNNLTDRIKVGQKHIKSEDRRENVAVVNGLIRKHFVKADVAALAHGPGMLFDFENSIRRSKTETPRYEFKQGILRLDDTRKIDEALLESLVETMCAIANIGPGADGYLFIGIADKPKDSDRVKELDGIEPVQFEHVQVVGVDREAKLLGLQLDRYIRKIEDAISNSGMLDPLKTQILSSMDVVTFKGYSILRVRIPKQSTVSFIKDVCFIRNGTGTHTATGPQIAAVTKLFM
jgi:predicted HTH transcriptional regulator